MAKFIVTMRRMIVTESMVAIDAMDRKEAIALIEQGQGILEDFSSKTLDDYSSKELNKMKNGETLYSVELD
jgi:hypothetical protein